MTSTPITRKFDPFDWPIAHFMYVARQHEANANRLLAPLGLKQREWRILAFVDAQGSVGVTRLARSAVIERSTIGKLLVRMKAKGWVRDADGEGDARVNPVELTARGRALLAKTAPLIESLFIAYRRGMTDTEHATLMKLALDYQKRVFAQGEGLQGDLDDE